MYIESCAEHCVVTYLLGVRDENLDNQHVSPPTHLFYVDFVYIFKRDPKLLAPPIEISREIIEGISRPAHNNHTQACSGVRIRGIFSASEVYFAAVNFVCFCAHTRCEYS